MVLNILDIELIRRRCRSSGAIGFRADAEDKRLFGIRICNIGSVQKKTSCTVINAWFNPADSFKCEIWWIYTKANLLESVKLEELDATRELMYYLEYLPNKQVWFTNHFACVPVSSVQTALTALEAATRIKFSRKTALLLEMPKRRVQFVKIEDAGW
ncbi:hypothetical protein PENSPDRAFT_672149 [Peniophora sp. CONT]|nr:hypothetical protein PENSPDRAFT_672149 [Peniophora sp. CONT]